MTGLIQELKEHHIHLLSILQLPKINGFATLETRELLNSARTTLLDHLRKEDLELYPLLHTAATKNPAIKETLDTFARDMAETSKVAIGFFEQEDQGGTDHDLSKEFGLPHPNWSAGSAAKKNSSTPSTNSSPQRTPRNTLRRATARLPRSMTVRDRTST